MYLRYFYILLCQRFPINLFQIEELTGLNKEHVILTEEALLSLNRSYCRESGVRNLKKHIEKIYRKAAYKVLIV